MARKGSAAAIAARGPRLRLLDVRDSALRRIGLVIASETTDYPISTYTMTCRVYARSYSLRYLLRLVRGLQVTE